MHSFLPTIWGSSFWMVMESVLFSFSPDEFVVSHEDVKLLLYLYSRIIPCDECRADYNEFLTEFTIEKASESIENYSEFLFRLRSKINLKIGTRFFQTKNDYIQYLKSAWKKEEEEKNGHLPSIPEEPLPLPSNTTVHVSHPQRNMNMLRNYPSVNHVQHMTRRPCNCGKKR